MVIPQISVIIPTYNRCDLVQQAIDSVLAQTYQDFELIVIDDGSTDGTGDILKVRYGEKIIYVRQENKGGPVARNLGLSIAKGKYIAFLDSDDLWTPEKLARQVPILESNPEVAVVACQAWIIDGKDQKLSEIPLGINTLPSDFTVENLLMFNRIPAGSSTCLVRRSVLDQVGGFSQDIRFGAEWDLWLRIAQDAKLLIVPEPLDFYRKHRQTLSFFPDIKHVDDSLADHLTILQRCVNKYPGTIPKPDYDRAVAYQYLIASLASFLLNDKDRGKARLSKVIETYPNFWKAKTDFAEQINVFADSYSIDQDGNYSSNRCLSFVDLLCANLPEALNRKDWIRLTQGKVRLEVGFRLHKNGERLSGLRQILSGVLWAPQLVDLAVLAVFAELFVGRGIVNRLRSLRHKEFRSAA
jgi:hypothetical protein